MIRQLPLPPPPPSSSKSHNKLWIIIGVVGLLFVLVVVGAIASMPSNQPQNNNTNPTATPTVTTQPTTQPTASPSPTPQPSKNIAISWSYRTIQSFTDQYGFVSTPDAGKVYVLVNMTITNNGYSDTYNTLSGFFKLATNNIQYSPDLATYSLNNWDSVELLNGGTFTGALVFQVPSTSSSFAMSTQTQYTSTLAHFNVIWTQT